MLTGDIIPAQEAKDLGLLLEVCDDVQDASLQLARRIASASPIAIRATTKTLRMRFSDGAIERAFQREADTQALAFASDDIQEGLSAIRQKRAPIYLKNV
jgi:enoyl-CoA hydratase/carnithine racemase